MRKTQASLTQEQELTASLEQRIDSAQNDQLRISSELSATQSDVERFQRSVQSSQQQCTDLEQSRSALESEADRLNTQLVSVQSQLSESKQQLAKAQQSMARLKAQLQLTDQDKAESEKQLVDARTGIANLRSRLDDIETELRKSKVQSSLQVHSAMSKAGLKEVGSILQHSLLLQAAQRDFFWPEHAAVVSWHILCRIHALFALIARILGSTLYTVCWQRSHWLDSACILYNSTAYSLYLLDTHRPGHQLAC